MASTQVVVYGTVPYDDDGKLTFINESDAASCARVWRAIRQAKTWGELFRMLDPDEATSMATTRTLPTCTAATGCRGNSRRRLGSRPSAT
jgi:hypothetical protein